MPNTPADLLASMPHWCPCQLVRVIDGDTVRVQAHLGLGLEARSEPVRLLGIETYELSGPDHYAADEAKRYLTSLIAERPMYLHTPRDQRDRYGRWLAWLWGLDGEDLICLNSRMIEDGMAWEWWPQGWGQQGPLPPARVRLPRTLEPTEP